MTRNYLSNRVFGRVMNNCFSGIEIETDITSNQKSRLPSWLDGLSGVFGGGGGN